MVGEIPLICNDIKERDKSFEYDILDDNILIVYSKTEKQAYARGYWFKNKIDRRLVFKVRK